MTTAPATEQTHDNLLRNLEAIVGLLATILDTKLTLGYIGNCDPRDDRGWTVWFSDYAHCWTRPGCNVAEQNHVSANIGFYGTDDLPHMLADIVAGCVARQHRRLTGYCVATGERYAHVTCVDRTCTGHEALRLHYYRTN